MEVILAGAPTRELQPGEAARIFTGAPLPEGADTVVMQENTRALDGNRVVIQGAAMQGVMSVVRAKPCAGTPSSPWVAR